MNTILLLDLDNTIIWDWTDNPRLMCSRFPILKEWVISQLGHNTRVGLLSWAVWDSKDLKTFNEDGIRQDIEMTHGFKFDDSLIFPLDDILAMFHKWLKMPFLSRNDLTKFVKKRQMVEEMWLRMWNQPNTKVILFDDTVPNLTLWHNDVENCSLELVDPWTIIKRDHL
jgi:hypothetical protein